jgi:amidophosphoribosyltransferase
MCGIVGLYTKNPKLQGRLGALLAPMLIEMTERGPDSAGIAVYRDPVGGKAVKLCLFHHDETFDWKALARDLAKSLKGKARVEVRASHAIVVVDKPFAKVQAWLAARHPDVRVMSAGGKIEIFKEMGKPRDVVRRFALTSMKGTHAIGHTRMATESAVTTEHSHPFSTGLDLCLVHNGSLSNHNRLREKLRRAGIDFQTDNDSEVAAGYLTHRLRQGDTLEAALTGALEALDGFFTFAVGTANGFAVLRDPIACKHAVLAESEDWVAMATEYRAIATLPGADKARIWEPKPATVYAWGRA